MGCSKSTTRKKDSGKVIKYVYIKIKMVFLRLKNLHTSYSSSKVRSTIKKRQLSKRIESDAYILKKINCIPTCSAVYVLRTLILLSPFNVGKVMKKKALSLV